MKKIFSATSVQLLVVLLFGSVLAAVQPLAAQTAPDPGAVFEALWAHYDRPVVEGRTNRSWTWGPAPLTPPTARMIWYNFPVVMTTDSTITVQYWDKGVMEINDPQADPRSPWYVTGGRLPVELMFGHQEGSDGTSRSWRDSYLTAIGDPGGFPAYPDLQPLYQVPGQINPADIGKPVVAMFNPDQTVSYEFTDYVNDPETVLVQGENNHGVPHAFLEFQRQQGLVWQDNGFTQQQVYDPLYIFGLPVTPAVWAYAQVGGVERPILFQVFERRVLSYNPANPPAFQVEMGNVGAHYYSWFTDPTAAAEFSSSHGREMPARNDPQVIYTVEVETQHESEHTHSSSAVYRIYRSLDGGATRELRSTGTLGPDCYSDIEVDLLQPASPYAIPDRIGLRTLCSPASPSTMRGSGIVIRSSYDGGKTFVTRFAF